MPYKSLLAVSLFSVFSRFRPRPLEDQLTRVQDPLGNTTLITYDVLGRKTGMRDPDMGIWSYHRTYAATPIRPVRWRTSNLVELEPDCAT
jgi:YD repeat-containing protein